MSKTKTYYVMVREGQVIGCKDTKKPIVHIVGRLDDLVSDVQSTLKITGSFEYSDSTEKMRYIINPIKVPQYIDDAVSAKLTQKMSPIPVIVQAAQPVSAVSEESAGIVQTPQQKRIPDLIKEKKLQNRLNYQEPDATPEVKEEIGVYARLVQVISAFGKKK